MIFVAVIVNITKIAVYPNTWAFLNKIHLIIPKYLVFSPKWFRSICVFFPLNLHMLCKCVIPLCLSICSYAAVPNSFGASDQFVEDSFSTDQCWGVVSDKCFTFFVLMIMCIISCSPGLASLLQLHLWSSGIRFS